MFGEEEFKWTHGLSQVFRKLVNLISAMESKNLVAIGVLMCLHMAVGGKYLYQPLRLN